MVCIADLSISNVEMSDAERDSSAHRDVIIETLCALKQSTIKAESVVSDNGEKMAETGVSAAHFIAFSEHEAATAEYVAALVDLFGALIAGASDKKMAPSWGPAEVLDFESLLFAECYFSNVLLLGSFSDARSYLSVIAGCLEGFDGMDGEEGEKIQRLAQAFRALKDAPAAFQEQLKDRVAVVMLGSASEEEDDQSAALAKQLMEKWSACHDVSKMPKGWADAVDFWELHFCQRKLLQFQLAMNITNYARQVAICFEKMEGFASTADLFEFEEAIRGQFIEKNHCYGHFFFRDNAEPNMPNVARTMEECDMANLVKALSLVCAKLSSKSSQVEFSYADLKEIGTTIIGSTQFLSKTQPKYGLAGMSREVTERLGAQFPSVVNQELQLAAPYWQVSGSGEHECNFMGLNRQYLQENEEQLFGTILRVLSAQQASKEAQLLALGELSMMHPMRNGNGRLVTVFRLALALKKGWALEEYSDHSVYERRYVEAWADRVEVRCVKTEDGSEQWQALRRSETEPLIPRNSGRRMSKL